MTIMYKITDIVSLSNDFEDKFNVLVDVEDNEKLYIFDQKIYLDKSVKVLQPVTRWWNNYNRNDTIVFIDREIHTYLDFVTFIREAYKNASVYSERRHDLYEIYQRHLGLISKYHNGVSSLMTTYKDDVMLICKIKSICDDLTHIPKLN